MAAALELVDPSCTAEQSRRLHARRSCGGWQQRLLGLNRPRPLNGGDTSAGRATSRPRLHHASTSTTDPSRRERSLMLPPPPDLSRPRRPSRLPFLDFGHQPTSQRIGSDLQCRHDVAACHPPFLNGKGSLSGGQVPIGMMGGDCRQGLQPLQASILILVAPQWCTSIKQHSSRNMWPNGRQQGLGLCLASLGNLGPDHVQRRRQKSLVRRHSLARQTQGTSGITGGCLQSLSLKRHRSPPRSHQGRQPTSQNRLTNPGLGCPPFPSPDLGGKGL